MSRGFEEHNPQMLKGFSIQNNFHTRFLHVQVAIVLISIVPNPLLFGSEKQWVHVSLFLRQHTVTVQLQTTSYFFKHNTWLTGNALASLQPLLLIDHEYHKQLTYQIAQECYSFPFF